MVLCALKQLECPALSGEWKGDGAYFLSLRHGCTHRLQAGLLGFL